MLQCAKRVVLINNKLLNQQVVEDSQYSILVLMFHIWRPQSFKHNMSGECARRSLCLAGFGAVLRLRVK